MTKEELDADLLAGIISREKYDLWLPHVRRKPLYQPQNEVYQADRYSVWVYLLSVPVTLYLLVRGVFR